MNTRIAISAVLYIATLLFGELLLVYDQPRRRNFRGRLTALVVAYPATVFLEGILVEQIETFLFAGSNSILLQIGHFALIFSATIPLLMLCWEIQLRDAVFFCTAGYCLEHIGNAVTSMAFFALRHNGIILPDIVSRIGISLFLKGAVMFLVYFFFLRPKLKRDCVDTSDLRVCAVSVVTLAICMVLNIMKGYGFGAALNSFTNSVICSLYALFGCFLCLFLQVGYFANRSLEANNMILDRLLLEEAKKHNLNKETVDLINMKCHDLKYQLRRLEEGPEDSRQAICEEIRQTFDIYDSLVKTENDVLDSVIMNVYPICIKQHVKFTYIVDGGALQWLSAADVASLFGNLLDNALESVEKEEESKRLISLNVRREKDMLLIHIHNQCSISPVFKDGLPVTTKGDDRYHGFGMRSVRYLVDKYKGEMRTTWDAGVFSVDILLPVR